MVAASFFSLAGAGEAEEPAPAGLAVHGRISHKQQRSRSLAYAPEIVDAVGHCFVLRLGMATSMGEAFLVARDYFGPARGR